MRITVCGSVGFPELIARVDTALTLAGHEVFTPSPMGRAVTPVEAEALTGAHHRKIDACDVVVAITKPDGSVGEAVASEVAYARSVGRPVWWLAGNTG